MLTGVPAVWDAETDLKVKGFEQEVSEEMSLNQTEAGQSPAAHCELQPAEQVTSQSAQSDNICITKYNTCFL